MANTQQLVAMGYIKAAFGVHGWLKLATQTECADNLLAYPNWHIGKEPDWQVYGLEEGKVSGTHNELLVKLTGVDDRDQAAALKGCTVAIARDLFETLADDEFYWADLVGMNVQNLDQQQLGTVEGLMQTGAHDVLVVQGIFGQKLIPFVGNYVIRVDMDKQVIIVDWGTDY